MEFEFQFSARLGALWTYPKTYPRSWLWASRIACQRRRPHRVDAQQRWNVHRAASRAVAQAMGGADASASHRGAAANALGGYKWAAVPAPATLNQVHGAGHWLKQPPLPPSHAGNLASCAQPAASILKWRQPSHSVPNATSVPRQYELRGDRLWYFPHFFQP